MPRKRRRLFPPDVVERALALEMVENDADAKTVKDYLKELLKKMLLEQDDFSGKRPWGNSDAYWKFYETFIRGGIIQGSLDEDGYIDELKDTERGYADELLLALVDSF